jgi:hypothetical protein
VECREDFAALLGSGGGETIAVSVVCGIGGKGEGEEIMVSLSWEGVGKIEKLC